MGLSPIPGIRGVESATVTREEREVQPPFALDPSGRLGDDAYNGANQQTERGLEEEDSEVVEEADSSSESPSNSSDSKGGVNFFA
ncbi:MAG: hypothetical protein WA354_09885 [Terracidiphilus sp.]